MTKKFKKHVVRIAVALVMFFIVMMLPINRWFEAPTNVYVEFALFLVPYLVAGYDVLIAAFKNILKGNALDEDFLMTVATIGAFAMVFFPDSSPHMAEGAAVMLFFQVGELFQEYAVGKSRRSIKAMMDIAPEFANVMVDGELTQVDPYEVSVGDVVIVKPGERIPLDGVVIEGATMVDTAALTGESVPRSAHEGDEVISGCINLSGVISVRVEKAFEDSTVSRILEMVENAAERKAKTENFITRFARYYTPIVVGAAVVLAIVPPLVLGGAWGDWVFRALTFLVVSCPCALVISVPLSFFGGIGGASKLGILVKGSNYLEALSKVETVVFDKTGTLTTGTFEVTEVNPADGFTAGELLDIAAHAEGFSDHPIALSVKSAYGGSLAMERIEDAQEIAGHGICATIDGKRVCAGNAKLLNRDEIVFELCEKVGTVLYIAVDGVYAGWILISDTIKPETADAISALRRVGVSKTVMLTGDAQEVAASVAGELGIDEYRASLLPQDKVAELEGLLAQQREGSNLAFVGDGINDAPVLTRADVGIAMGAMGSDAAIEAADVVLMDDDPRSIARAIRVARKTMRIVWQNIIFAIGVKVAILVLAAIGLANMWLAVFGDVGVAVIAILNAMRAMGVKDMR